MSIITSVVSLARAVHLRLVAEGVKSQMQADRLPVVGCDQGQGYSPSVPLERIDVLIAR